MNEHLSTERMNDLLDGALSHAEESVARGHLDRCAVCREEFALLAETVAAVRALPRVATAPAGGWARVEARIRGTAPAAGSGAEVVRLPGARRAPRLVRLSLPQLAAAATIVAVLSGALVWFALGGGRTGVDDGATVAAAPRGLGPAARAAATRDAGYDAAIDELQALVDRGRDVLAPETMTRLAESLATIDTALAEVRAALAEDPGSELLQSMLVDHQTAKMRVLRQAASAIEAQS